MAGGPVSYGIESLEKTLDEKERELDQLREKTRMYQEEQLKKVLFQICQCNVIKMTRIK